MNPLPPKPPHREAATTYVNSLYTRTHFVHPLGMSISLTKLREDLYRLVDEVLETGKPLEIQRKGRKLLLIPEIPENKLDRLSERQTLAVDPESIVHIDWSGEWKP